MSPLNIHPEESTASAPKKKKSKTLKVMLGIGALVLVPVIGSTFAASITINSGTDPVEFGQGVIDTAVCDSGLTVEAGSAYLTPPGGSLGFHLKTITISDINLDSGCEGKTLVVSVDVNGTEAVLSGSDTQVSVSINDDGDAVTASAGFTASINGTGADGVVVITITAPKLLSENVDNFLIQSS
jgi:hypothetical protein